MQFSIATLAILATAVVADSTLYVTQEVTITSCAPSVTDCPARSTVVSLTSYPVVTPTAVAPVEEASTITEYSTQYSTILSCHPTVTDCPYGKVTSTIVPANPTGGAAAPPAPSAPAAAYPLQNATSVAPVAPAPTAPTTLIAPAPNTAELPAVTITVYECPAASAPAPVSSAPAASSPAPEAPASSAPVPATSAPASPTAPVVPAVSGVPVPAGNGTTPIYATGTGATTSPSKTPVFTGAASVNTISALAFAGVIAALFA